MNIDWSNLSDDDRALIADDTGIDVSALRPDAEGVAKNNRPPPAEVTHTAYIDRLRKAGHTPRLQKWLNPSKQRVSVRIYAGYTIQKNEWDRVERMPYIDSKQMARWITIGIGPGETAELLAEWHDSIHQINEGVIIGGACPTLVRIDPPQTAVLIGALNPDSPKKLEASTWTRRPKQ